MFLTNEHDSSIISVVDATRKIQVKQKFYDLVMNGAQPSKKTGKLLRGYMPLYKKKKFSFQIKTEKRMSN